MLKFFYNGIKANGGKLQKAYFWKQERENGTLPEGTITISARDYKRFSDEIRAVFTVQNDTDSMTDYFDNDRIRVLPSHPLYAAVNAAYAQASNHAEARLEKREQRLRLKYAPRY